MNSSRRSSAPEFLLLIVCVFITQVAGAQDSPARRRVVAQPQTCRTTTITSASGAAGVAVDDRYVYFGDRTGNIFRAPKDGGSPVLLSRIAGNGIFSVAVDSANVYVQAQELSTQNDSVFVAPKGGGDAKLLVTDVHWSLAMIPDGDWLYVVSAGAMTAPPWPSQGRIVRARKDGSAVETIASGLRAPMSMRLEADTVYFTEGGTSPADTQGGLRSVPKNGGAVTNVATLPAAWSVAHDGSSFYVLRIIGSDLGAVDAVSRSDGSVRRLLDAVSFEPFEPMEVAGRSLLFMSIVNSAMARIESVPVAGGDRRVVAEFARNWPQFAVDSCAVYFSTPTSIERVAY